MFIDSARKTVKQSFIFSLGLTIASILNCLFFLLGMEMNIHKLKQVALIKKLKLTQLRIQNLVPNEVANALDRVLDEIMLNYNEELLLTKLYEYIRGVIALYDNKQINANILGDLMISETELSEILR
jgi:hypothetical protein